MPRVGPTSPRARATVHLTLCSRNAPSRAHSPHNPQSHTFPRASSRAHFGVTQNRTMRHRTLHAGFDSGAQKVQHVFDGFKYNCEC
eukprot:686853-Prymnesium_polylepis.1